MSTPSPDDCKGESSGPSDSSFAISVKAVTNSIPASLSAITSDNMAPVRAAPTLTKSKPAYPLLAKKLQELLKGPSIEICVGSHPYLDHLFAVPKALLCYFSVTLRRQFASKVVNIVALEHSDKKAVSWVMKWMIAGGVDKTAAITTTAVVSEIDVVLGRLQVVDYLTIGGLYETLIEKLHKLLRYYPITVEQIRWTYGHTPYTGAASIRTALAAGIVQGIIDGVSDPSLVLSLAKKSRIFTTDLVRAIPGKELSARVHKFQLRAPFTIAQLRFFYAFSGEGSALRKTMAKDLLALIDADQVTNLHEYRNYGWENFDFSNDMDAAILAKEKHEAWLERTALKTQRKAERDAKKAGGKTGVDAAVAKTGKHLQASAGNRQKRKKVAKGKKTTVDAGSVFSAEKNAKDAKDAKNAKKSVATKKASVSPNNPSPVGKNEGSATATRTNIKRSSAGINENAKPSEHGKKLVHAPKPAKRLESNAMLRLTKDGQIERER